MLDYIGIFHLMTAIVAMITGPWALSVVKGSKRHKQAGYIYILAMLGLNISAFLIYKLFNGFGPFHVSAIVSFLTVCFGSFFVFLFKPKYALILHMDFMSWSVIGLYAAFFAEITTRIVPHDQFWFATITSSLITFLVGFIIWKKYRHQLLAKFNGRFT